MTSFSEIEFLESENKKNYVIISLILAEIELIPQTHEIQQNFINPDDFVPIVVSILNRISKIKLEKYLEKTLNLN